ncbi:MAG: hypothetical protein VX733_12210 [Candidatus Latescibacterota bacterium]|nr:hypothetical protein [Candidatus Latescibacterota bacterium]
MSTQPHIGVLREKSLHAAVKRWYSEPEDELEATVDGYVVDIVREDAELVEIQTRSFAPLKTKLRKLTREHRVRLVHPIPALKWIVRIDENGEILGRRKSPKRGRAEHVFEELVSIPDLIPLPTFTLEVCMIEEEEVRLYDGKGSWRHPEWRSHDRILVAVVEQRRFHGAEDFLDFLPGAETLPRPFTNRELATASGQRLNLTGKITYCLRKMGVLGVVGKKGNAQLLQECECLAAEPAAVLLK